MNQAERLAIRSQQLVREVQPLRDLGRDVQRQRLGDDLAVAGDRLHDRAQVVALDVLEHDEVLALLGDPEVVDLHDVAVRERRVDARLGQQHGHEPLVGDQVGLDALDRHQLLEALGADDAALVHLGHAADGDAFEQLVLAELHWAETRLNHRPSVVYARERNHAASFRGAPPWASRRFRARTGATVRFPHRAGSIRPCRSRTPRCAEVSTNGPPSSSGTTSSPASSAHPRRWSPPARSPPPCSPPDRPECGPAPPRDPG